VENTSYITIGKIISYWGTKGFLKVYALTFIPERFYKLFRVFVSNGRDRKFFVVQKVKPYKGNVWLFKLKDIDTIQDAERLRGWYIEIPEEEKISLPEDTYFIDDLIGLKIYSQEGEYIGTLKNIIEGLASDLYIIEKIDGEALIPAVKEFIKEVNLKEKKIIVKLIEGLL